MSLVSGTHCVGDEERTGTTATNKNRVWRRSGTEVESETRMTNMLNRSYIYCVQRHTAASGPYHTPAQSLCRTMVGKL